MLPIQLDELGKQQFGLLTHRQMVAHIGPKATSTLIRGQNVFKVLRGVYRMAGVEESPMVSIFAAVLGGPADAVASHESALFLFELVKSAPDVVDITVSQGQSSRTRHVKAHKAFLPRSQVTVIKGVPSTTAARAIIDVSATFSTRELGRTIDEAIATGRTTAQEIDLSLRDIGSRGRRGARRLRALLDERLPLAAGAQSVLEQRFFRAIKKRAFPNRNCNTV